MPGWIFSGYRRPEHLPAPQPRPAPPATEAPTPAPLPTLDWANPVHTNGACTCDVIYSKCRCEQRSSTAP